ncbi:MAG: tetratricopeptide repeat protein [Candidatus Sumerlaeia bacterium]|nr:tetratricopeptide repeat protein [Candidatus Sumerlaeia bacterium]
MSTARSITILPFAYANWREDARGVSLCRGLASLLEGRLRLLPEAQVSVQHMVARPTVEGEPHQYLLRTRLWDLEEALSLPTQAGVETTHLVQGELVFGETMELTLEAIDRTAGYSAFREKLICRQTEFLDRFFPMLGRLGDVIVGSLDEDRRAMVARRPTSSFIAFEWYLAGLSRRVEIAAGARPAGLLAESFEPFQAALREDPEFPEACIAIDLLAQECFRQRRGERTARRALLEAAGMAPQFPGFARTLGIHYFETGRMAEARRLLESYLESTAASDALAPPAYVRLARIYREAEGAKPAVALLRRAVAHFPKDHDILESLGVCLAESGEREEAELLWCQVLDEAPGRSATLASLAGLRWEDGDLRRARELFQRAIESPEASALAYSRYVDFLLETAPLAAADEVATQRVERYPENWRHWVQLGRIRRRLGQTKAAEYCLDRAEDIAGVEDVEGEILIARFAAAQPGDFERFQKALAQVMESTGPQRGDAAEAALRLGEAAAVFQELAERYSRLPFVWRALAQALGLLEQFDAAVAAQERLVRMAPRSAEARSTLGVLMMRAGRGEQALPALRRAVMLSPRTADFRVNLVLGLENCGRHAEARKELDRIACPPEDWAMAKTLRDLRRRLEEPPAPEPLAVKIAVGWGERLLQVLRRINRRSGGS